MQHHCYTVIVQEREEAGDGRNPSHKCVDKRQLCNCNLTLLHTKELKGAELASNRQKTTEKAYTVCASDSCSTMLFYGCFQWRCQCYCNKKIKTCGWRNVLVVQVKSPPA